MLSGSQTLEHPRHIDVLGGCTSEYVVVPMPSSILKCEKRSVTKQSDGETRARRTTLVQLSLKLILSHFQH